MCSIPKHLGVNAFVPSREEIFRRPHSAGRPSEEKITRPQ